LKPSEKTPLTAGLLATVLADAGLPVGWLSVVTGDPSEIVAAWSDDDRVAAVTFTGSSRVGWQLKAKSPRKHHTMELGSATAMYIAEDADLDAAVEAAGRSAFGFSGQVCLSLQRLYVDHSVFDAVVFRLKENAESLVVGDPSEESTQIGPMITPEASARVLDWIDEARDHGATVVTGGAVTGPVLHPTVIAGLQNDARLVCTEVFGPVVSVLPVNGLDDALEKINAVSYGLNASIYTADLARALAFGRRVESGQAIINDTPSFRTENMPYGGVKDSGQGREGVGFAVAEFTRQKLVVLVG
jgi:acyl-CoA reductase-like NAD-dependent aldehyde dehydrogenase